MATVNQEKLRSTFFDQSELLFFLFDKDLNLIDVNENGLKTFHFKRGQIIGKHITELSPDNKSSGRLELYKEVLRTGVSHVIDEMKPHPSLGNMYFRIRAFKVSDGLGLISKNITDMKESQDELETFIYKFTHDLRSPIASILGITNIVQTQITDIAEAKKFCSIVQDQAKRIDTTLQILMETMHIRKGEKLIHLIDFDNLVTDVMDSLGYVDGFNEVRFTVNISAGQKFYSDKLLLCSLFLNLVENAIKYRRNIAEAYVDISVADNNGGVLIKIADNGIGIPLNLQDDVYKMFFRATNQASGSGLGLYTVNHTIRKLGGTIKLSSQEKVGTVFTVYIPNETDLNSSTVVSGER